MQAASQSQAPLTLLFLTPFPLTPFFFITLLQDEYQMRLELSDARKLVHDSNWLYSAPLVSLSLWEQRFLYD